MCVSRVSCQDKCEGGELFDRLNRMIREDGAFTEHDAGKILLDMMGAVNYLHLQGIVHR